MKGLEKRFTDYKADMELRVKELEAECFGSQSESASSRSDDGPADLSEQSEPSAVRGTVEYESDTIKELPSQPKSPTTIIEDD
jgi:hypothetical protein